MIEELKKLKEITLNIIGEVQKENDINGLLAERQKIINSIMNSNYNKKEVKDCYMSLGINIDEENLKNVLEKYRNELKEKIKNSGKRKTAFNSYSYGRNTRINFFSTKV